MAIAGRRRDWPACALQAVTWLVLVIGWFADDSGVIVPAAALPFALPFELPFALPLAVSMAASVSCAGGGARYFGTAFAGSSVAGKTLR